jgi:Ca2+-binding EF-hand superfamily protein
MGLFGAKRVAADVSPAPMGYRVQRSMKQFMLLPTEVELFWEVFKRYDVSHEGFITTDTFFDKMIREERTELGDAIFSLVDIEDADKIEFGEFVQAVCTFAMLSTDETLRFAFLVSVLYCLHALQHTLSVLQCVQC